MTNLLSYAELPVLHVGKEQYFLTLFDVEYVLYTSHVELATDAERGLGQYYLDCQMDYLFQYLGDSMYTQLDLNEIPEYVLHGIYNELCRIKEAELIYLQSRPPGKKT